MSASRSGDLVSLDGVGSPVRLRRSPPLAVAVDVLTLHKAVIEQQTQPSSLSECPDEALSLAAMVQHISNFINFGRSCDQAVCLVQFPANLFQTTLKGSAMKSMLEYLAERHASKPAAWLTAFDKQVGLEATCLVKNFLASRIVYYPGSGNDGSPVRLFNTAGAADCFLYVDYMLERDLLLKQIEGRGFKGYRTYSRIELGPADFGIKHWSPHLTSTEMRKAVRPKVPAYGFLEILEKTDFRVPGHERLAILFMCADGHAAYDALFCQPDSPSPPFAIVIQDHSFGGNWSEFGNGGALQTIAMRAGIVPELMLVGDNSPSWAGFARIEGVAGVCVDNRQWRHLEARLPASV